MFRVLAAVVMASCASCSQESPRELCLSAQEEMNAKAIECNPATGTIDISCQNYGEGDSCGVIEEYFACLRNVSCDNGMVVIPTNCALGACE